MWNDDIGFISPFAQQISGPDWEIPNRLKYDNIESFDVPKQPKEKARRKSKMRISLISKSVNRIFKIGLRRIT